MVDILKETLAYPLKNVEMDSVLPSPKDLMRKVLIKGKRATDAVEEDDDDDDDDDDEDEDKGLQSKRNEIKVSMKKTAQVVDLKKPKSGHSAPSKTHPDLSVITYLGTGKVKSFAADLSRAVPCDMMCSYSEGTTGKYMKDDVKVAGWVEHNKTHLR
jgi:hypothetical protein